MPHSDKSHDTVKLYAVGDVMVERDDPDSMFALTAPTIKEADVAFCQVETNYSVRGTPQMIARVPMRAHPSNAASIKNAGFTVGSLAGNHSGDYGAEAFLDTIDLIKGLGLEVVGAGRNIAEARKPAIVDVKGTRIAFLAYCSILPHNYWADAARPGVAPMRGLTFYEQIERDQPGTPCRTYSAPFPPDLREMVNDITKARQRADVVVVSQHWGIHFVPASLADYQREVGHAAIDAGADIIFGHHAHILKGIEVYKRKVIMHSMGNFAFDWRLEKEFYERPHFKEMASINPDWKYDPDYINYSFPPDSRRTVFAKVLISDKKIQKVSFVPTYILNTAQPQLLTRHDKRSQEVFDYMTWLNSEAGLKTKMTYDGDDVVIS